MRALGLTDPDDFFNFLLSVAAILHIFLVKLEVKLKMINYRMFRFDTTTQTNFFSKNKIIRVCETQHAYSENG